MLKIVQADKRYAIDANKLKNELGWEPSLQFEGDQRLLLGI